jgi:hypothetical protein
MAAILDIWITKPGDPCYVDDSHWTIRVSDCHGMPYHWASRDYSQLPAPQGHWAGAIPPGTYVVQAAGKDAKGSPLLTDHAIAHVGCEGSACVFLYVGGQGRGKGEGPALVSLEVRPPRVASGAAWEGMVRLSGPALPSGADVSLASDTPAVAGVPADVVVPAGTDHALFMAPPTLNHSGKPVVVTITAEYNGVQKSAKLVVLPAKSDAAAARKVTAKKAAKKR